MSASNREKVLVNEIAVQKLLRLIKEEKLQPGDKLPPERTLCQQLKISRTSLREALHNLKTNGIVRIRQGSGIYVDIFDESIYNRYGTLDKRNYKDILAAVHHMLEARTMIEPYCARQVAITITPEQLSQLWEHEMEEYRRLIYRNGSNDVVNPPGIDFEQSIINFLGNPIISSLHNRLNSSWKSYLKEINAVVLSPNHRHKQHLAIINALEEHDPTRAEKAMRHHLNKSKESICMLIEQHKNISHENSSYCTTIE